MFRADVPDESLMLHGVVAAGSAISPTPGDTDYAHTFTQVQPPAWLADGAVANGRFLAEVGVPMPILHPEYALLVRFTAL
jgi:alpha-galactosidase